MAGRSLVTAQNTQVNSSEIGLAWLIYLDILGDPVAVWTGLGDIIFSARPADRTNYMLQSEAIATTPWTATAITRTNNTGGTDPRGAAWGSFIPTTASAIHFISQILPGVATDYSDNTTYIFSGYVKYSGYQYVRVSFYAKDGTIKFAIFDVVNGTLFSVTAGYTATITANGTGIWFLTISGSILSGSNLPRIVIYSSPNNTPNNAFVGDGTSGLFIGSTQYELGSAATAYIKTTTASVTIHTYGNYFGTTGDSGLDGNTFLGLGGLGEIGKIMDTNSGSDSVTLTLPGCDLTDVALRQVVFNKNQWQFRRGYIWLALFDSNSAMIGNPLRVKTGRMDQMTVSRQGGQGTVSCVLESYAAYQQESLFSRYSEQKILIDSTDISQDFAASLANQTAIIGVTNAAGGTGGGGGGGTLGGGGWHENSA